MEGSVLCFEKAALSETDIHRNLEIPQRAAHLPPGDEIMYVCDLRGRGRGRGRVWQFKAPVRRGGRRSMAYHWRHYTRTISARPGDRLKFKRSLNRNFYFVEVYRLQTIRLFGVTIETWAML